MSSSDTTNGTESSVKRQKTSHGTAEETTPAGDKTKTTSVTTTTTTTKHHHNPPQQHKHKHYHPCSFVTWNCNGFSTRAKHNRDQLKLLVRSTGEPGAGGPDVICIQEARLKAEGPGEKRGRLLVDDKDFYDVTEALKDAFGDYRPFWSLADKKYAGTLTLIRKSCVAGHNSGAEEERGQEREREHSVQQQQQQQQQPVDVDFAAFTVRSAIELILRRLGTTREECGLPEVPDEEPEPPPPAPKKKQPKNKQQQQQQTSLKSFFAAKPKPKAEPKAKTKAKTKTNGTTKSRCPHHPEGRFQFFFFPGMDLVQTYVPNNGGKDESFARRKKWDEDMKQFFRDRAQILRAFSRFGTEGGTFDASVDRKLLWCGDMNATLSFRDGSHWEKRNGDDDSDDDDDDDDDDETGVYEWFRDTSVCFSKFSDLAKNPPELPENRGMPGFTPAERSRFSELLKEGDFCDLWREQHPRGVSASPGEKKDGAAVVVGRCWGRPDYTWRGSLAKTPGGFAKYQGRGQRLDYFLLSPSRVGKEAVAALQRRESGSESGSTGKSGALEADCHIRGYGTRMEGLFCSSDHSAVELRLRYT